jgi:hypothetical protein
VRPRLAFLADLAGDVARSARLRRTRRPPAVREPPPPTAVERASAEEVKRRLDETRERLKRETASPND